MSAARPTSSPRALEIARDTAIHAAPVSVAVSKRLLWQAFDLDADAVERAETALHEVVMTGPDAIEGPVSHVQRRTPAWQGRVSRDFPKTWPAPDAADPRSGRPR